jgi:hypothetical protein
MPEDAQTSRDPRRFSPRNFLRARRPERFSDSVAVEHRALDRAVLEYHLDSLTSRNQEGLFEDFARKLTELEICPNLLPHTGPTGGGDSKVDSETYPVSEAISAGWFVGAGGNAGKERWAFAISAKKAWAPKVRSDVAAVAKAARGYSKAFFISNQYIPDKKRAAEEDTLSKKHGFDVRILDRTWILDRVFSGHHEQMAIARLAIAVNPAREVRKGPLDIQRERELTEIEARIKEALQGSPGLAFVDDCLEAATLARNLELSRTEIDGRFVRAQRAAVDHGTRHQQVLAFYEQAWTAFWWHEDISEFVRLYDEVEKLAQDSPNVADVELLHNLWTLLSTAKRQGDISQESADIDNRTKRLRYALDGLAGADDRPSVALQARALRAQMWLTSSVPNAPASVLRELHQIVKDSEGLIGFPLTQFSNLITELSEYLVGNKAFEELFDAVVQTTARRQGQVAGARMLLKLGAKQLDAKRPYEAIRTLGRALADLYKNESRDDMIRALFLCAFAYERVGLLWAARGTLLNAASIAANEWWTHSTVSLLQVACYNRLKWVELQLGRVPQLLAWHEIDIATQQLLVAEGYSAERLARGERDFDLIFSILLLRSDVWQLRQMETLPDVLDSLRLPGAALALTFALGHVEGIPEEEIAKGELEVRKMFEALSKQPAGNELPSAPLLCSERILTLRSVILGCVVELTADSATPCVELGESVLAAAESLLSTSVFAGITPRVARLRIRVRKSDFADFPFRLETNEVDGAPSFEIRCPTFQPYGLSIEKQQNLKDAVADLLAHVVARAFIVATEDELRRIFRDERGLQRAVGFTSGFGTLANVLGTSPKTTIEQWAVPTGRRLSLERAEEWDAEERRNVRHAKEEAAFVEIPMLTPGDGRPPDDLFDMSHVKHTDITFESLIVEPLWNQAKWRGVGFAAMDGVPPWMVLAFENEKPAAQIVTQLVREVGTKDSRNRLRITIVRGINRKHPHHYRVVIGSNVDPANLKKYGAMMARIHEMEPSTDKNLRMFLAAYERTRCFFFGVAAIDKQDSSQFPTPLRDGYILKNQLSVRDAWEVGLNDPDMPGVLGADDVIIPEQHRTDAPVLELLKWKRDHGRSLHSTRRERSEVVRKRASKRAAAKKKREARKAASKKRQAQARKRKRG